MLQPAHCRCKPKAPVLQGPGLRRLQGRLAAKCSGTSLEAVQPLPCGRPCLWRRRLHFLETVPGPREGGALACRALEIFNLVPMIGKLAADPKRAMPRHYGHRTADLGQQNCQDLV